MKRVTIILLMLVYGLSSSGATINLHYCCGKLDDISFSGKKEPSCKMGNHLEKSGCCNDKQISASIQADQQPGAKWVQSVKQGITVPVYQLTNTLFTNYAVSINRLARGTPKPPLPLSIFIKNCVFRI